MERDWEESANEWVRARGKKCRGITSRDEGERERKKFSSVVST